MPLYWPGFYSRETGTTPSGRQAPRRGRESHAECPSPAKPVGCIVAGTQLLRAALDGDTANLVAELPGEDLMVLRGTKHLVGVLVRSDRGLRGGADISGPSVPLDGCTGGVIPSTGALTASRSSEANVGVAEVIKHAAITVIVVARLGVKAKGLAQRDGSLEHGALHVVNEDGEVAGLIVAELGAVAVIGGRVLCGGVGVLAVASGGEGRGVGVTALLQVGAVVEAVELLAEVDEGWPVLDLDGVVLAIRQVGDGRSRREVCIESVV